MTSQSRLLQLPLELIQIIAELAGPEALLALRLTSKYAEAAVFDQFAHEFLSEVSCYVVDPARLRRTKNLTSTTRLVSRIKNLKLHIDSHNEFRFKHFSLAPAQGCTLKGEAGSAWDQSVNDAHHAHRDLSIDQTLVTTILDDLSAVHSCQVVLEICHLQTQEKALLFSTSLTHDLLNATIASNYPLRYLELDDYSLAEPEMLTSTQTRNIVSLATGLRTLSLVFDMEEDITDDSRGGVERALFKRRVIPLILEHAQTVIRLEIHGYITFYMKTWTPQYWSVRSPANTRLTSQLLATDCSSTLQQLNLSMLSCREHELVRFVERCRPTLTHLELDSMELVEWSGRWTAIFEKLAGFDKLRRIWFSQLSRVEFEHITYAMLNTGTEDKPRDQDTIDVEGAEQVQEALLSRVQSGIVYIPHPGVF